MVRPPSYDSNGMKKGAWSEDEDAKLRTHVGQHGHRNWRLVPIHAGLKRCGKSCRLRWVNYLQPGLRRGNFTADEEDLIIELHSKIGTRWSTIAGRLRGRTDHEVKNHWHAHLKKRVAPKSLVAANKKCCKRADDDSNRSDQSEGFLFVEKPESIIVGTTNLVGCGDAVWSKALNQTYLDQENMGFMPFADDDGQLNNLNVLLNNGYSSDHSLGRISCTSSIDSIQSLSPQNYTGAITTDDLYLWDEAGGTCFDSYNQHYNDLAMFSNNIESNYFGYSSINSSWMDILPDKEVQQSSIIPPATNGHYSMDAIAGVAYYHEKDDFFAKNPENIDAIVDIFLQQGDSGYEDV